MLVCAPTHRRGAAMSSIDIRHPHSLPLPKARKAVEDIAKKLAAKFDMDYGWDGDTLNFNRSGVDGHIHVGDKQIRVTAQLGFLLSALKGTVEQEIRRVLAERFD
jgi:putative polyhydroxyalkanoate system protein